MEEAFWAGDQAKEGILKDLISSRTIPIERKGIDTYMARNHMRVAMISNERWVVPASADERRFAVFDCGDQHRGDTAYFKAMSDQMKAGGLAAMLYDLLTFHPAEGWERLCNPRHTSIVQGIEGALSGPRGDGDYAVIFGGCGPVEIQSAGGVNARSS
jgi:hypothetical protein